MMYETLYEIMTRKIEILEERADCLIIKHLNRSQSCLEFKSKHLLDSFKKMYYSDGVISFDHLDVRPHEYELVVSQKNEEGKTLFSNFTSDYKISEKNKSNH